MPVLIGYEVRSSVVIGKSRITMNSSMLIKRSAYRTYTGTKKIHAFVAALMMAVALPGCALFQKSSDPAVDQKITADVQTSFKQHAELEAPDQLEVKTINRVVYLNGTTSTGLQRERAEAIAQQVPGVTKVVNSISVTK
jgi:BON domain